MVGQKKPLGRRSAAKIAEVLEDFQTSGKKKWESTRVNGVNPVTERCFEYEEVGVVEQLGGETQVQRQDCQTLSEATPARWAAKRH